jgi:GntR family phosphonate transport system transcriptional regulator
MRQSGSIVWREIEATLGGEIAEGLYPAGAKLPAEAELAARFGVNRHTVRRALSELQSRGTISIERGRGTFVTSSRLTYPVSQRTRFSENVSRVSTSTRGPLPRILAGSLSFCSEGRTKAAVLPVPVCAVAIRS